MSYRPGQTLAVPAGIAPGFNEDFHYTLTAVLDDWSSALDTLWLQGTVDGEEQVWTLCLPENLPVLPGTQYGRHGYTAPATVRPYVLQYQGPSRYGFLPQPGR